MAIIYKYDPLWDQSYVQYRAQRWKNFFRCAVSFKLWKMFSQRSPENVNNILVLKKNTIYKLGIKKLKFWTQKSAFILVGSYLEIL